MVCITRSFRIRIRYPKIDINYYLLSIYYKLPIIYLPLYLSLFGLIFFHSFHHFKSHIKEILGVLQIRTFVSFFHFWKTSFHILGSHAHFLYTGYVNFSFELTFLNFLIVHFVLLILYKTNGWLKCHYAEHLGKKYLIFFVINIVLLFVTLDSLICLISE